MENRCHYCKKVVGSPPAHVAATCPVLMKKKVSGYSKFSTLEDSLKGVIRIQSQGGLAVCNGSLQGQRCDVLIDSGACGLAFINSAFAQSLGITIVKLHEEIEIFSVDGSRLGQSNVEFRTGTLSLRLDDEGPFKLQFLLIPSPNHKIILGIDWLKKYNPMIDWVKNTVTIGSLLGNPPPLQTPDGVENLILEFHDVFSDKEFPNLPPQRPGVDMDIELLDDKSPPFGPIYSLSKPEEEALRNYLDSAMSSGIISPSTSPAGSPVMFVKKSDGSLRLCVDYRSLNAVTKSDKTALPIIKDMLKRTIGCRCFSKIDLKSAFHLIRIKSGKEYLTAFQSKYMVITSTMLYHLG